MTKTLLLFLFFLVVSAFELMGQVVSNNNLYVGYFASDNFVFIDEGNNGNPNNQLTYGGTNISYIFVGYGSNSTYNTNYFSQTYAYIPGSWYVNYQGNGNAGIVSYSGFYVNGNCYLGYEPGSSNGSIQVVGSFLSGNSNYYDYSTNFIGYQGSSNSFFISNYGTNSFTYTIIGGTNTNDFSNQASNNTFSISDSENQDCGMFILSSSNQLIVGPSANNIDTGNDVPSGAPGDFHIYGYSNTVTINNGSQQADSYIYIGGSNAGNTTFSNNTIFITNNSAWNNYGDSTYGNDIIASSGNQIIISNYSYMSNYLTSNFYLGLYGSSNSMTLASNSTFALNGYGSYNTGPNPVSMYVGGNAGTISNNIYIYDASSLALLGGGISLYVGNTNGASGNIYISNNSGDTSSQNLDIDGNTYIYNGTLSLHGTNATLYYNNAYGNSGNFYIYNGTLYCGENPNAFTQVETIGLGNDNGTNATNTNTNASLYLSTNGVTSMTFNYLQFWNNVNIYNINPNASQQIINVTTEFSDFSTATTIGKINFISNVSLDNNQNPIINFVASTGFNNDFTSNFTFSVTGATVGQSSDPNTGSNYLYFWIQTNANITVAQSINETNAFLADTVTCTAGTFTSSAPNNGVVINTLNMISNSSLVLNEMMTARTLKFLITSLTANTNLYIANGAELATGDSFFGASSGANCKLINEGILYAGTTYLGYEGGGNTVLDITNGGSMTNYAMMVIGSNGNNALNIVSNTTCYASNLIIESAYIGNSNIVNVNGGKLYVTNSNVANTNPYLNYSLIVGYVGSHDYLNISNGGYVTNSLGVIGYSTNSSNNYAYVTGSNSTWINTNGFYVGFMGGKNNLLISNGGSVYVNGSQSFIGLASSSNTVTVTGTNSIFSSYGALNIGYYGSYNKVIISNGATITNSNSGSYKSNYAALLGGYSNNNSVTIESNSVWTNNGNLFIGYYGSSNSVTNNGGMLNAEGINISENSGKYNSLVINNSGTVNTGYLVLGGGNTNALLNLTSTGASFNLANSPYLYGTISNAGIITINDVTTNNGSIYNTGTITISNVLYNYGYISNGGTITATDFYNYGTLVGNPVHASVTSTSTPTLQSSGMMMGDHIVEMPHMIPLEQNDEISINEENAAYFVKEALQLASSLVYAQKPPPKSKPSHKKAFHHKKTGKKVDS